MRLIATARVTVTVEVTTNASWNGTATAEQIHKQASEEAVSALTRLLHGGDRPPACRVVGVPSVSVVTTNEKK